LTNVRVGFAIPTSSNIQRLDEHLIANFDCQQYECHVAGQAAPRIEKTQ